MDYARSALCNMQFNKNIAILSLMNLTAAFVLANIPLNTMDHPTMKKHTQTII